MDEKETDFDYENFDFSTVDESDTTLTLDTPVKIEKIRPKSLNGIVAKRLSNNLNTQSQFDPSIDMFLLDSPASAIGDVALQQYDDEFLKAQKYKEYDADMDDDESLDFKNIVKSYNNNDDDYDEEDFVEPNAQYQAMGLTQAQLNEKYDLIEVKTLAMVKMMDLRLYYKNRADLKKSLISDMMSRYFSECQYISKETMMRVRSIVSIIVDHEINDLFTRAGKRKQILFNQIRLPLMTFLQENVYATVNLNQTQKDNYANYLFGIIMKKIISPASRIKQYNPQEYEFVVQQTKALINKTIEDRAIKRK